jgi:hypothetical protein
MAAMANVAIAISSGTLKGVYGQGILSAFEEMGVKVAAYGCASSSVISAGLAGIGKSRSLGLEYWQYAAQASHGKNMSKVVKDSIAKYFGLLTSGLFSPNAPRFLIATSHVNNDAAAAITQGPGARHCGRRLLIDLSRGNSAWVDENLTKVMFDSEGKVGPPLTSANLTDVAYASTRMLHAWEDPAEVDGKPYVDASYTCSCPAFELADLGYQILVVIDVEVGPTYTSLTRKIKVEPDKLPGLFCLEVKPTYDPADVGVSYLSASSDGIKRVYDDAFKQGLEVAKQLRERTDV